MQPTDKEKQNQSGEISELSYQTLLESSDVQKVEILASLFFTTKQIASFIGMAHDEFIRIVNYEPDNEMATAYHRGKMMTEIKLRIDSLKFALSGSPQALEEMKQFKVKQSISENEE